MKKAFLLLAALMMALTACGGQGSSPSPQASSPAPTPSVPARAEPAPSQAPAWWERLSPDGLPKSLASAEDLDGTGEQCFMLGNLKDPDISLYGVAGEDVVLLRQGDTLTPFPQVYRARPQAAVPDLWWDDFDGDGISELAVRYLSDSDQDHLVYDLHIYEWDGSAWADCAVTQEACAGLALDLVEIGYDAGAVTLSCGQTSAVYHLPKGAGAGRLALDSGFFRCQDGVFTVVLGARVDNLSHFANILADIVYDGSDFTLRNIRVEPTSVV